MITNKLLSGNDTEFKKALKKAIEGDRNADRKERAREGVRYYDFKHDILNNRIFYIDENGVIQEDVNASNIKIPHAFLTELVDQKVQYLLSKPVKIEVEDQDFKNRLLEYYDEETQLFLQEVVEGASLKGFEYAYARTNSQDKVCFQVANSLKVFPVYNEKNEIVKLIRYYDKDIEENNTIKSVTYAEVWDSETVTYYVTDKDGNFILDDRSLNPAPHITATDAEGNLLKRDYGEIPFFRLSNNKNETTDLEPIKALIDDYDVMACFLSNNLQDFAEAIYVVKGFQGDNLTKLRQNIKAKKTVGVGVDGGVDIQTVDIPVKARETKLEIDKQSIYKFGMGFDSSQVQTANGSITNIAIQSGYSLLNMKCNKAEVRLRTLLAWMNDKIVSDINRRYGTSYKTSDIEIIIEKEVMTNKKEIAEIEKLEEEKRFIFIQSLLLAAPKINDDSVIRLICEQFDLDFEDVKLLLETQMYTDLSGLTGDAQDSQNKFRIQ